MKAYLLRGLVLTMVLFLSFNLWPSILRAEEKAEGPLKIDLYVMSQCPYSVLVESAIIKVKEEFAERIEIDFYFIAGEEDGEFRSLHGAAELEEDIRQLVILRYWPDKFWHYLSIRDSDYLSRAWQGAAFAAGLEVEEIEKLVSSDKVKELFRQNIKKAAELKVTSSPTIYIDGQFYEGARGFPSLLLAVCNRLDSDLPTCQGLPECFEDRDCLRPKKYGQCQDPGTRDAKCLFTDAPQVKLTVLSSPECLEPDTAFILQDLKRRYRGLEIKEVDITSVEGKGIVEELGIKALPVLIFDENLTKTRDFERNIKKGIFITLKDGRHYLLSPSVLPPGLFLEREPKHNTLDLFVMSHCPAGTDAEEALIEKLKKEKGKFVLNIHYIIKKDPEGKFSSLRGEGELHEDIEQMIVRKYYPDKFFDFLLCRKVRLKDEPEGERDWQACAEKLGIDAQWVWERAYKENVELLGKEFELTQRLQIDTSPTFLWENRIKITGVENLRKIEGFEDLRQIKGGCR